MANDTNTTPEMIKRVAQKLRDKLVAEDGPYSFARDDGNFIVTLDGTFDMRELACTAIEEMHEPTDAIVDTIWSCLGGDETSFGQARDVYQAAIDTALGKQS